MFFFLPIGVEGFKVRVPILSVCIALLCVLSFLVTWVANDDREGGLNRTALNEGVELIERHPYLQVPESFAKQYLKRKDLDGLEAVRQEWLSTNTPPSDEILAEQQRIRGTKRGTGR